MRLIDADKLIELFTTYVSEDKKIVYQPRKLKMDDVKNAPTVEAIPIELIYKIRNLYLKNDCIISAGVCNEILNMWGKENEAD